MPPSPNETAHTAPAALSPPAAFSQPVESPAPVDSSTPPRRPAVVVTVPTFNEAGNIELLLDELLALGPGFHVLVIDDDSPDGTWRIVAERAAREPRVELMHRRTDKGRGRSGRDGFVRALAIGAPVVVEMDADLSHHPRYIPDMIRRLNGGSPPVGLVLGSRATRGGKDADRGAARRAITRLANLYIRVVLGVPVRDCNSGFRAWKRATLERIDVGATFSAGPAIVQELLFKTARAGIGIAEVPIEFQNRLHGESTLTFGKLLTGYFTVLKLRYQSWIGRIR